MTIADSARNLAISLEAKKDALAQRQNGDWRVSFTVQSIDMDPRLTQAQMGTRYAMVLVEIGDDEQPVPPRKKETAQAPRQDIPQAAPDGAKRPWKDLQPAQQAGMRSSEPTFIAFLKDQYADDWRESNDGAACIRLICGVHSRAELGTDHRKRVVWYGLDQKYQTWLIAERVGA